jgi:hypothetical protein
MLIKEIVGKEITHLGEKDILSLLIKEHYLLIYIYIYIYTNVFS